MQLTEAAEAVLNKRYYLTKEDGTKENWDDLCRRVAQAAAGQEKENKDQWEHLFFQVINNCEFLPNSPCLMNAGTEIGQLSACFVLPVPDSMDGIFTAVKHGALIHKSGGGTGYSFSRLRPKGATVNSTQGVASGPLSFISAFNAATETVKQGGKRRGANMAILRVDHPDILDFVDAKQDLSLFTNFNFSVAATDAFMDAAKAGQDYDLIDPHTKEKTGSLNAREVLEKIATNAWTTGEPGLVFIDAANRANPTPALGEFEATNPCGEQWLLPYEACNLGSINLAYFVTTEGKLDRERLGQVVRIAVRFLDNIVDCNKFPIPEIKEMVQKTRKIGLGIMGLHDALILMGIPYGSEEGAAEAGEIMGFIRDAANSASITYGQEKGFFPAYSVPDCRCAQRRNAALTSIQPTGTVSMIANCSSGCEPYFAHTAVKTVMDGDRLILVNPLIELIAKREGFWSKEFDEEVRKTGSVQNTNIPAKWKNILRTAQEITPKEHINMQAMLQPSVDSSISKTINLPSTATVQDVLDAYLYAYQTKCKGITVYRDGSRMGQPLTTNSTNPEKAEPVLSTGKKELPDVLNAKRYRLRTPDKSKMYIIVCFDDEGNPAEVFAKFPFDNRPKLSEKATMWNTTCRMVSLALRCGIPLEDIIKQLSKASGHMYDLPAQLAKLLKTFLSDTGREYKETCPDCGGELIFSEGCNHCQSCGYSKCS